MAYLTMGWVSVFCAQEFSYPGLAGKMEKAVGKTAGFIVLKEADGDLNGDNIPDKVIVWKHTTVCT